MLNHFIVTDNLCIWYVLLWNDSYICYRVDHIHIDVNIHMCWVCNKWKGPKPGVWCNFIAHIPNPCFIGAHVGTGCRPDDACQDNRRLRRPCYRVNDYACSGTFHCDHGEREKTHWTSLVSIQVTWLDELTRIGEWHCIYTRYMCTWTLSDSDYYRHAVILVI